MPNGTLTIYGSHFSSLPEDNIVKFDGITAVVQSATPNSLVVTVPKGIHAGPRSLSVTVDGVGAPPTGSIPIIFIVEISVSTIAGTPQVPGYNDQILTPQPALSIKFNQPYGLAVDTIGGMIYVADAGNNVIRVINLGAGTVYTVAGDGATGLIGSPSSSPQFVYPTGVFVAEKPVVSVYATSYKQSSIRVFSPTVQLDLFLCR